MKKIYFLNLITFLSMIFIVSGVGIVPASQKGELPAEGPVKVSLGTALSVNNALIYIALDQLYFIEEGVSLEFIPYDYAKLALDDLIAGRLDLTSAAETPFVMSCFEHRNFKLIATIGLYDNDPKIVARKDAGISNAADLKGKRIGTTGARQSAYFFLHVFLREYGLKEEDVIISFGRPQKVLGQLAAGELDAISIFEPYAAKAKQDLGANSVLFQEPSLYNKFICLLASDDLLKDDQIKNDENAVVSILKALIKAANYLARKPDQAHKIVADKLDVSAEVVTDLLEQLTVEVSLNQTMFLLLEDEARWAQNIGFFSGREIPNFLDFIYIDALEYIDPTLVTVIH